MKNYNYILFAPPYDENSGGAIVIHKLCHRLNEMGHEAFIWPFKRKRYPSFRKKISIWLKGANFLTNPEFDTPIAKSTDIHEKTIVVYPEVVDGNPLEHNQVVRWLLHKPGFHTNKEPNYSDNELFFYFQPHFADDRYVIDPDNRLFITHMYEGYNLKNTSVSRSGSCYLMHKGNGRKLVHDQSDSIKIDGLSHTEIAKIFKKTKYFYSYDEFTMYSVYAAISGCISVVIPESFKSRKEWVENNPNAKYGIAYGLDDTDHAIETQEQLLNFLLEIDQESDTTVTNFINKTQLHFNK